MEGPHELNACEYLMYVMLLEDKVSHYSSAKLLAQQSCALFNDVDCLIVYHKQRNKESEWIMAGD